jgi:hypothetical protein
VTSVKPAAPLPAAYSNGDQQYRPQWVYFTPPGFKDEPHHVPFRFAVNMDGSLNRSLPIQLDNDADYIVRGIYFFNGPTPGVNGVSPGLMRLWDAHGNPLSAGLSLSLGGWANAQGLAHGFPIEPEVACPAGSVLLVDLQLSSQAGAASFTHVVVGTSVPYIALVQGSLGNTYSLRYLNPGAANVPLSVAVVGVAVTVTLATNGAAVIITTAVQARDAIFADPVAGQLIGPNGAITGPPGQVEVAFGPTLFAGGGLNPVAQIIAGALLGVRRQKEC